MQAKLIDQSDIQALADYYQGNQKHFAPWSPKLAHNHYSPEAIAKRLPKMLKSQQAGENIYWLLWKNDQIIAHCTLSNIVRGVFQAAYMGYGIDQEHAGQGHMLPFCQHVIEHAFDEQDLHRIMANYMPHNQRSGALLKRLGFVKEGLAKDYLKINGRWENHILTSITRP